MVPKSETTLSETQGWLKGGTWLCPMVLRTRVGRQTLDPQLAVGGFQESHGQEEEEEAGVGHDYNGTDRKGTE